MSRRLTKKQAIFVDEFIRTGNGTQSALIAYPDQTYNAAGVTAHDNLRNPKINSILVESVPEWSADYVKRVIVDRTKSSKEDISLRAAEIMSKCKGIDLQGNDTQPTTHITVNALITSAPIEDIVSRLGERLRSSSQGAITSKTSDK